MARSKKIIGVYTLGYQGIDLDTYVNILAEHSVGIVIDVRETPWSYKRGFSKSPLSTALSHAGIAYVHVRSAGNPASNRRSAVSIEQCLSRYRTIVKRNPICIEELQEIIDDASAQGKSVCLTCYEKAPHECHRSILLEFLLTLNPSLSVMHLATQ